MRTWVALSRRAANHSEYVVVWRTSSMDALYRMGYTPQERESDVG